MQADETFKPRLQWSEMFCSYIEQNQGWLGGGLPNSKLFEKIFCLCLEIFHGGGVYLIPKLLRNFLAWVWTFFRKRGWGVAWFKRWWGTFLCFGLDIFQGTWGNASANLPHQNKIFTNYVSCRNWAVRNPAGTRLDSILVNKQVVHSLSQTLLEAVSDWFMISSVLVPLQVSGTCKGQSYTSWC